MILLIGISCSESPPQIYPDTDYCQTYETDSLVSKNLDLNFMDKVPENKSGVFVLDLSYGRYAGKAAGKFGPFGRTGRHRYR